MEGLDQVRKFSWVTRPPVAVSIPGLCFPLATTTGSSTHHNRQDTVGLEPSARDIQMPFEKHCTIILDQHSLHWVSSKQGVITFSADCWHSGPRSLAPDLVSCSQIFFAKVQTGEADFMSCKMVTF